MVSAAPGVDDEAFRALIEPHIRELRLHCYRMLGGWYDAEDALQEALLRAWRHLPPAENRGALRAWLYKVTTNVCLTLGARREPRLQPYPDALLDQLPDAQPASQYDLHESVQLAFVAAVQLLPARQRAVLILRDVLGWSAREVADLLDSSVTSVNSALQRARSALERERRDGRLTMDQRAESIAVERKLVQQFVDAFRRVDIDGLVALLKEDAVLTMPPEPVRLVGRAAIGQFFATVPAGGELDRFHLVATRANGQPAVAAYLDAAGYGVMVLTIDDSAIASITGFADASLFAIFGLPELLE